MYAYSGFGQSPPPKTHLRSQPVDPTLASRYPEAQKQWCIQAVAQGLYTGARACNQAVAAGAPMTDLSVTQATPGSPVAESRTKLYVGIAVAALVVGVGAYLITK